MENLAGVGVLAIAAFWAMYLLPQRVLQRTQVVEARTDDRHSGAMRILAVARRSGRDDPGTTRDCPPGQVPHGRLLTGPMPVVIAQPTAAAEGVLTMDRPVIASQRRPGAPAGHARGGAASPARPLTPASRASETASGHPAAGHPAGDRPAAGSPAAAPVRLSAAARARAEALAARRAAAARRRLALTLTLLATSAIAWTAVSAFSIHVAVPAVLTAALVGVLALGRRAVVTARRADAEAARRASGARPQATTSSQAAPARADAARADAAPTDSVRTDSVRTDSVRTDSVRPGAARDARRAGAARGASVTGRAVHGSQTTTQMISSAEVLERTTASAPLGSAPLGSTVPAAPAGASVEQTASDDEVAPAVREVAAATVAESGVRGARQADEARRTDDSERVLGGFSLPRPTYTMKAAAPRREVAPLADADVTTPANAAERAAASAASVGSAEEPSTTTEGLGLGLDAILARRRASGA